MQSEPEKTRKCYNKNAEREARQWNMAKYIFAAIVVGGLVIAVIEWCKP